MCKYDIQYVNGKSNYMCNKNITIEPCSNMYSVGVSSEPDFIVLCVAFIVHHARVSSVKSRNLHIDMFNFLWPKETEQIKGVSRKFHFFWHESKDSLNLKPTMVSVLNFLVHGL